MKREELETYQTLQGSDEESLKDLTGLVTVSNILESLSGILSANVQKNFLSSSAIR
jgi:hypothetical protein